MILNLNYYWEPILVSFQRDDGVDFAMIIVFFVSNYRLSVFLEATSQSRTLIAYLVLIDAQSLKSY